MLFKEIFMVYLKKENKKYPSIFRTQVGVARCNSIFCPNGILVRYTQTGGAGRRAVSTLGKFFGNTVKNSSNFKFSSNASYLTRSELPKNPLLACPRTVTILCIPTGISIYVRYHGAGKPGIFNIVNRSNAARSNMPAVGSKVNSSSESSISSLSSTSNVLSKENSSTTQPQPNGCKSIVDWKNKLEKEPIYRVKPSIILLDNNQKPCSLGSNSAVDKLNRFAGFHIPENPFLNSFSTEISNSSGHHNFEDISQMALPKILITSELEVIRESIESKLVSKDPRSHTLTPRFYSIYKSIKERTIVNFYDIKVPKSISDFSIQFKVITKIHDETLYLVPSQSHVLVVYSLRKGYFVGLGYMTSQMGGNIYFSKEQPFNPNDENKQQNFHPFDFPIMVPEEWLRNLDPKLDLLGKSYINQYLTKFFDACKTSRCFIEKTGIFYDPRGVILSEMKLALEIAKKEDEQEANDPTSGNNLIGNYISKSEQKKDIWYQRTLRDKVPGYQILQNYVEKKIKYEKK